MINPFCKEWHDSLPVSLGGIVTAQTIALLAAVDWGSWITLTALAITAFGGAALGLWRQYRLTLIELRDRAHRRRPPRNWPPAASDPTQ